MYISSDPSETNKLYLILGRCLLHINTTGSSTPVLENILIKNRIKPGESSTTRNP